MAAGSFLKLAQKKACFHLQQQVKHDTLFSPFSRCFHACKIRLSIKDIIEKARCGEISLETAETKIKEFCGGIEHVQGFAQIDHNRSRRTGMPEVIFAEGKTADQVKHIFNAMGNRRKQRTEPKVLSNKGLELPGPPILATRLSPEAYEEIKDGVEGELHYWPLARLAALGPLPNNMAAEASEASSSCGKEDAAVFGHVAVVSAGTSDLPVAEEAALTAKLCGIQVSRVYDVGVAGIDRLFNNLHLIKKADMAVCVAGMDGAMPSVVAGLVDCPVVAVPTSVGYGAAFSGVAPLLGMLNSCSPGLAAVNIDNGFGAAVFALKMLRSRHL